MDRTKVLCKWVVGGPNTTFNGQLLNDTGEVDAGLMSHTALRVRQLVAYGTDDALSLKFRLYFEGRGSLEKS